MTEDSFNNRLQNAVGPESRTKHEAAALSFDVVSDPGFGFHRTVTKVSTTQDSK